MPRIGQENLETVMIDFFGALRRGDFEAAAGLLDSDVSWHGREIDALEFTRADERVVLGARGPRISAVEDEPLEGHIFNVSTLRDGRIVRIDDYRSRPEALTAAGVAADVDWR